MKPIAWMVLGALASLAGLLLVSLALDTFAAASSDDCGPDGYPVEWGITGVLPMCYAPGPVLQFYNGTVVPYCAEADANEDCFVYEVLTPADRAAYEASLNATAGGDGQ